MNPFTMKSELDLMNPHLNNDFANFINSDYTQMSRPNHKIIRHP